MKFEAKTYRRVGAIIGSIVGFFCMIIGVCMGKNIFGAILLILCSCIGFLIGNILEKKQEERQV